MAFLVLIGLLMFAGIAATVKNCEMDSFSACSPPDTFPLNFPGTEKDLDRACLIISRHMECVLEHELECNGDFQYLENYNRVYGALQDICRKDSKLHRKFSENIGCIKMQLNKQNETRCLLHKEMVTETFELTLITSANTNESEPSRWDWDMLYCLQHVVAISCFLDNVEACGNKVNDMLRSIIQKSGFVQDGCPDETLFNATKLLSRLGLDDGLQNQIVEVFLLAEENS